MPLSGPQPGHYISCQTGRELILWDGCCNVHDNLTAEEVEAARCPSDALVMALRNAGLR